MNDRGTSDGPVLPAEPPNNPGEPWAEVVEGRGPAKGNTAGKTRPGRSAGQGVSSELDRVRRVARKDKDVRFTALLHHDSQGVHPEDRRAFAAARVAASEDKVLQRAVVEVLNAVFEEDFLGFSDGFRPGRSQHDALDAQGASVSPLLSNVYLHYVFDLSADQWRRRHAQGEVILCRFADDDVAGFEHREDAKRFLADLRDRFATFGLELHPEKTRLIECGRYAAANLARRGDRKPETLESWDSRTSVRGPGTGGSTSSGSRARRRRARS